MLESIAWAVSEDDSNHHKCTDLQVRFRGTPVANQKVLYNDKTVIRHHVSTQAYQLSLAQLEERKTVIAITA